MKEMISVGAADEPMNFNISFSVRKRRRMAAKTQREVVPVFFAADDNYLPFLDVAIASCKENACKKYDYRIYVLHSGINGKKAEAVMRLADEHFKILFVDVSERLAKIADCLRLRDYYTSAIYYRLFIVGMFPEYDKAVYLDCDTVVLGDVSELYFTDLKRNLIGAVADGVVSAVPVFCEYTQKALGIEGGKYFNSGVIVMNLKYFRKENFYQAFYDILSSYEFRVAPDQDCLNLLCKNKVHYFHDGWNRMPQAVNVSSAPIKLVHYNLAQKPWHYDGVKYEEYFWEYAKKSVFYQEIVAQKEAFTPEMAARDEAGGAALLALAKAEAERGDNYYARLLKK